ncbi:MAG: helix-turn-helix transcriptional regulator [Mucilaginibacter polytrichastri]|nr:helix-turn-helix transcriptional regulator [Mucilaginibacter polytrichastri]
MNYRCIAPPGPLSDVVRYFWVMEATDPGVQRRTFVPFADGCPGMIFHYSGDAFRDERGDAFPQLYLYGQTLSPVRMNAPGTFGAVGLYFYPHALRSVFGIDAFDLTTSCLCAAELPYSGPLALEEQLVNAGDADEAIRILSAYLQHCLARNTFAADAGTRYALGRITSAAVPLSELQRQTGQTERTFERRFRQTVGVPPKLFWRICRFQETLKQLRHGNYRSLTELAYSAGYADQSHFIRSFREFAGFSPRNYARSARESIENFAERL